MKKMKENKGFTLVELIVVIVILAILAAILVPALLGYIDKAKSQQVVLDGKSVMTAAQTELSSAYAKGAEPKSISSSTVATVADVEGKCTSFEIYGGANKNTDTTGKTSSATKDNHNAYTVYAVKYVAKSGEAIYYAYNTSTGKASWDSSDADFNAAINAGAVKLCDYTAKTSE